MGKNGGATAAHSLRQLIRSVCGCESADAKNVDSRKLAPQGHKFFTPGNVTRGKKLTEGAAEGMGEERIYITSKHKRWRHNMPGQDYLNAASGARRGKGYSSNLSVVSGGSGSLGGPSAHGAMSRGGKSIASSYSDPSLRCGRGGVQVPWDLTVATDSLNGRSRRYY